MPRGIDYTNSLGSQLFSVPMNEEGRAFLRVLKKYRQRGTQLRTRGRGPRGCILTHDGKPTFAKSDHVPLDAATWVAVYLRSSACETRRKKRVADLECEIAFLRYERNRLESRVENLEQALVRLTADALAVCRRTDIA